MRKSIQAESPGAGRAQEGRRELSGREKTLPVWLRSQDWGEENKTSCQEREKKKKIKPNILRLKSFSLTSHSPALYVELSLLLPGESCNKCLSLEPRNFSNLPAVGRVLFIWISEEGGVCFASPALSDEYFGEDETAVENLGSGS